MNEIDYRDIDAVWDDISEFELPATILDGSVGDSIKVLSQRMFEMTNYMSQIIQFKPEHEEDLFNLKERLEFYKEERNTIVNRSLIKYKQFPEAYQKNEETMVAYIEHTFSKEDLNANSKKIIKTKQDIIKKERLLADINIRYDLLQQGMNVCVTVIQSISFFKESKL